MDPVQAMLLEEKKTRYQKKKALGNTWLLKPDLNRDHGLCALDIYLPFFRASFPKI